MHSLRLAAVSKRVLNEVPKTYQAAMSCEEICGKLVEVLKKFSWSKCYCEFGDSTHLPSLTATHGFV